MSETPDIQNQIADYVLGITEGQERTVFEARMAADAKLARAVDRFEQHLSALDDTAQRAEIPSHMWGNIERAVSAASQRSPVNRNGAPQYAAILRPAAMAASIVIALGVGFAGGTFMQERPQAPMVVAVLLSDDMEPGAIIEAFGDDSVRIVPLEALIAPPDSTLEVWTLPDEATGPVSLGTFQEARDLVLGGPDLPSPQPDQLYEITLEPAGGSPTGRPTGPILLKGYARAPVI